MKTSGDKIKTIGLIHEDIFTDFAKEIIHSVAHATIDRKDINIVVLAGRQDDSTDPDNKMHLYKSVYNTIYDIEDMCSFDGLIVTLPNVSRINKYKNLKKLPKVFVACDVKGETTINYNDEMGIREAVDYLVRICGYTRLCMLGGRDDNADARKRKAIFERVLADNGVDFTEKDYEKGDMSVGCVAAANRLLSRNPDVQAIFCVNDQSAVGLYNAMRSRGLVPGKDIKVFGFDNTRMAGDMIPPLSSIGTDSHSLGQKALELLLAKINGQDVFSLEVPTRFYGRDSCLYEMYEYNTQEMLNVDSAFIYRMFDDVLYRYKNETLDRGAIDLRRLFFEFISKMLTAMKNRFMSDEQFEEIIDLINIFFENGAMKYTDANKFVRSVERLQRAMNASQRSLYVNSKNNRLFSIMKDRALLSMAITESMQSIGYDRGRNSIFEFNIMTTVYENDEHSIENVYKNFDKLGLDNSALYLFDKPVIYNYNRKVKLPGLIFMKCVVKSGELYMVPENKQECPVESIFKRDELPKHNKGYTAFPLFYGKYIFGVVVCGMERELLDKGEYIANQLGRSIYMSIFKS